VLTRLDASSAQDQRQGLAKIWYFGAEGEIFLWQEIATRKTLRIQVNFKVRGSASDNRFLIDWHGGPVVEIKTLGEVPHVHGKKWWEPSFCAPAPVRTLTRSVQESTWQLLRALVPHILENERDGFCEMMKILEKQFSLIS